MQDNGAVKRSFSPEEFLKQVEVGIEVVLPSGLEVRVRPVTALAILDLDYPDELTEMVNRHAAGKPIIDTDETRSIADTRKAAKLGRQFNEMIAKEVIAYPKLVNDADYKGAKGTFPISKMQDIDLGRIQFSINVPLMHLKEFFRREAEAVELIYISQSDEPASVGTDRPADSDAGIDTPLQPVPELDERVVGQLPL